MSNILFIFLGAIIGVLVTYFVFSQVLKLKNDLIDSYKKGIDIHNKRELRLIFITQSTKDYVKQQQNILKQKPIPADTKDPEELCIAARYMAFKDIENIINHLEKNSESLTKD